MGVKCRVRGKRMKKNFRKRLDLSFSIVERILVWGLGWCTSMLGWANVSLWLVGWWRWSMSPICLSVVNSLDSTLKIHAVHVGYDDKCAHFASPFISQHLALPLATQSIYNKYRLAMVCVVFVHASASASSSSSSLAMTRFSS